MEAHLRYLRDLNSTAFSNSSVRKSTKKKTTAPVSQIAAAAVEPRPSTAMQPRIDFVQRNIDSAAGSKSRLKKVEPITRKQTIVDAAHKPGAIPRYVSVHNRSVEVERTTPKEAKCPPGMRLMTDDEKVEGLAALRDRKLELEERLGHAPLSIESKTMQRQYREMEQQLNDVDASVEHLKRRYVFVPA